MLLLEAGGVYRVLRLLGACYLIYVGWRLLRTGIGGSERRATPELPGTRSPFWTGFVTTISNPKSAVFWTSVFSLVMPVHAPIWFDGAVAVVVGVQSMGWYGAVALLLSTSVARANYVRLARWLDCIAGAVMVLLGLRLVDELRREIMVRST